MLTGKWNAGTLTQEDIYVWLCKQPEGIRLFSVERNHVAMCMHHIYLWHMKEGDVEPFLSAIVKNDFVEICMAADDTNRKVLPLYAHFLYNVAPMGWRKGRSQK